MKASIIESSTKKVEVQKDNHNHQKVSSEEDSSDEDNTIQLATESSQGNSIYDGQTNIEKRSRAKKSASKESSDDIEMSSPNTEVNDEIKQKVQS